MTLPTLDNLGKGPFFLMAGSCAIESNDLAFEIAEKIDGITKAMGIPYIFKGSYRKANRTKIDSFTGIGDIKALEILQLPLWKRCVLMLMNPVLVAAAHYKIDKMPDPDKLQSDIATQCASMFNMPVRPQMVIEKINGLPVLKIWVDELPAKQKPIYFTKKGLPSGALRRIGSTDQHCTDDDMHVFYQDTGSYDQTPVKGTTIADVDENASGTVTAAE